MAYPTIQPSDLVIIHTIEFNRVIYTWAFKGSQIKTIDWNEEYLITDDGNPWPFDKLILIKGASEFQSQVFSPE